MPADIEIAETALFSLLEGIAPSHSVRVLTAGEEAERLLDSIDSPTILVQLGEWTPSKHGTGQGGDSLLWNVIVADPTLSSLQERLHGNAALSQRTGLYPAVVSLREELAGQRLLETDLPLRLEVSRPSRGTERVAVWKDCYRQDTLPVGRTTPVFAASLREVGISTQQTPKGNNSLAFNGASGSQPQVGSPLFVHDALGTCYLGTVIEVADEVLSSSLPTKRDIATEAVLVSSEDYLVAPCASAYGSFDSNVSVVQERNLAGAAFRTFVRANSIRRTDSFGPINSSEAEKFRQSISNFLYADQLVYGDSEGGFYGSVTIENILTTEVAENLQTVQVELILGLDLSWSDLQGAGA